MTDNKIATEALRALRTVERRQLRGQLARSAYVPAHVEVRERSRTYRFERGGNATWRLVSVSDYGNHSFVHGPGCDASGYVVTDPGDVDYLNGVLARLGNDTRK